MIRQSIFSGLEERFKDQLAAVRLQYPSEPVRVTEEPLVVHWEDGIRMLRDAGHEVCPSVESVAKVCLRACVCDREGCVHVEVRFVTGT